MGYPKVKNMSDMADLLKKMQKMDPKDDAGGKTYAVSAARTWMMQWLCTLRQQLLHTMDTMSWVLVSMIQPQVSIMMH